MANYSDSVLLASQQILGDMASKPEFRHKDYAITRLMLAGASGFQFDLSEKKSDSRPLTASWVKKRSSDAVTARSHNHTAASNGDSGALSLSFVTKGEKFSHSLKQAENNVLADAQMLAGKLQSAWINLFDTIETAMYTYLNANRTQVNNAASGGRLGTWDNANFVWDILNDEKSEKFFFQYFTQMIRSNKHAGMIDVVCDPIMFAIAQQYAQQGSGNNTNTGFQFSDINFAQSLDIPAAAGYDGQIFGIVPQTVGLTTCVAPKNAADTKTRLQTYTTMQDPFGLGITANLHIYEAMADTSLTGGTTQDETTQFELTVDYATMKAPLSVANESTIFKAGLKDSGN